MKKDYIKCQYKKIDQQVEYWCLRKKVFLKWLAIIIVISTPILFTAKNMDTDTWFLLNSGRYIIENGFTTTEPFSMFQGLEFSFQQWLTDVYFYWIYTKFNEIGLILVIMIESMIMLALYYKLCMLVSNRNTGISLIYTICFSAISAAYMVVRPQITTYIILILELIILEKYVRTKQVKILAFLPLLSVAEINLHASMWWMLFIFMLPYLCELRFIRIDRIQPDIYPKRPLWIFVIIMILAGFLNPYGLRNMMYLINSGGSKYAADVIGEMGPINYKSVGLYLLIVLSVILAVTLSKKKDSIKLRYLYLYVGCAFMALVNVRSIILFALAGFMIGAYECRKFKATGFEIARFVIYIEILIGVIVIAGNFNSSEVFESIKNQNMKIIKYLDERCVPNETNLFTGYNIGALYEYEGYKCSLDARMEVFTKRMNGVFNYFDEFVEVSNGKIYYKEYLEKYNFDYYVLEKEGALYISVSHDKDFETLFDTDDYALLKLNKTNF